MAVELFADKQIRLLEAILTGEAAYRQSDTEVHILNQDIDVSSENFTSLLEYFDAVKLIKLGGISEMPFQHEGLDITSPDNLVGYLTILDRPKLEAQLAELKNKYPKKAKPLLRKQTTELIAKAVGELASGTKLKELLESFGVDRTLIVYPNTKWRMVQDVLDYLVRSDRSEDTQALKNFFKEFCHPLTHDGDAQRAKEFEKQLNGWVEYDGFRIIRGELVKTEPDTPSDETPMIPLLEDSGVADVIRENRKAQKSIEAIIKQEEQQVSEIKSAPELKVIKESWNSTKKVLDQIAYSVPRITDAVPTVSVDFKALQVPVEHVESVMLKLKESGVFSYFVDKNSPVITTGPLRRFLAGHDVIIKDFERFEEVRKSTSKLVEAIQERWDELQQIAKTQNELLEKFTKHLQPEVTSVGLTEIHLPPSPRQIAFEVEAERQAHAEKMSGQEMREKLKNDRIIAERGIPLKQHVLKTILEELENFGNGIDTVEIDFFHFNFESNRIGISRFETFLDRLKNDGYLQGYTRTTRPMRGSKYSFVGIDKEKIHDYLFPATHPQQTSQIESITQSSPPKKKEQRVSDQILMKLSQASTWESIELAFTAGGDRVEVIIADESAGEYHFEELGFRKMSGKSLMKPVRSWQILQIMALSGPFSYESAKDLKAKNDLEFRLRSLFPHLNGSPTKRIDGEKKYESRVKLTSKVDNRQAFVDRKADNRPTHFLKEKY